MGQIFNMENPFWRMLGKLLDIAVLNLLWFICCIPIVTIGPATTAVYYVTLKIVRDEEGYIAASFFKSFKENLKQGIIIGVIMTMLGIFFLYDIWIYPQITGIGKYLSMFFIGIFIIYLFVLTYVFPLLAKFVNSVKQTFQNALIMSVRHFFKSVLMILITIAVWGLGLTIFAPLMVLGMGLVAFLQSYLLIGIFDKYIPEEEKKKEQEDENENLFMTNAELKEKKKIEETASEILSEETEACGEKENS